MNWSKRNKLKITWILILMIGAVLAIACRYTIREIGFSTLSQVTYILYRVNENDTYFPQQLTREMAYSNVKTRGISKKEDPDDPVVRFAIDKKLMLPAYILTSGDGRRLYLSMESNAEHPITQQILHSPLRNRLSAELPSIYAKVLLIEGKNRKDNQISREIIAEACINIENIMPHMPKQVDEGPSMEAISSDLFSQERIFLWSLGLDQLPDEPVAFVIYGKGRIVGEQITFSEIKADKIYKYLSIIGADCECGLDRKWILGHQTLMDWPASTRQELTNILGFDVDNPMILNEMSRILSLETVGDNFNPDGISFEPTVIDLDEAFAEVPEIDHQAAEKENVKSGSGIQNVILYSVLGFVLILIAGAYWVLRRKNG